VLDRRPPDDGADHAVVDVTRPREAEAAVRRLGQLHGGLDGVVTTAGIDVPGPLGAVDAEDWERVIAVNLVGTAAVVRAALPDLEQRRGRIVTVASTLGFSAVGDATAYCASKFGVVGFTRALAAELAGRVGVTLVTPGGMRTPFFDGRDEKYRPGPDAVLNDPADVARAILFALCQPPGCELRELVLCPAREGSWPP
jgi:NAD(P)-dependent dehydrogenase (short-subunit alcohol dehydrogenase family)